MPRMGGEIDYLLLNPFSRENNEIERQAPTFVGLRPSFQTKGDKIWHEKILLVQGEILAARRARVVFSARLGIRGGGSNPL